MLRDSASRFEKETEVQQVLQTRRRNKEQNTSELTRFFDEMFGESFSEDYVFEGFDTDEYINNEVETSRLEADRQQAQGSSYVEDDVNTVNLEETDEQLQLLKVTFAPLSIFGNHQKKLYESKLYLKLSRF